MPKQSTGTEIERLIALLGRLPGLGHRSARKAALTLLKKRLEDARAGGDTLAEAAEKLKIAVRSIEAIDRSGQGADGIPVKDLPKQGELVPALFATDVGVENDPLQFDNGYVWYEVVGITPARERSLEEVKDEVEVRWMNNEIATRLAAKANALVEKLNGGGTLKDLAAADRLKVETANSLKRGDPTETFSAATLQAVFRTAKGGAGKRGAEFPAFWEAVLSTLLIATANRLIS